MTSFPATRRADDAYGRRLSEKFGVEDVPSIATRSLQGAEIVATEVSADKPLGRLSDPIAREDAYILSLVLLASDVGRGLSGPVFEGNTGIVSAAVRLRTRSMKARMPAAVCLWRG